MQLDSFEDYQEEIWELGKQAIKLSLSQQNLKRMLSFLKNYVTRLIFRRVNLCMMKEERKVIGMFTLAIMIILKD